MKNWFNPPDATAAVDRLERLSPSAKAQWGRFTAHDALCHLADPLRVALGEKDAKRLASPVGLPVIAQLVVWVLPWPKGAPTAPEYLPGKGMTNPTEFDRDKQTLLGLLQRFSEYPADQDFPPNPVFGRLTRQGWGRLMWRHVDHHLRQFGA